MRTRSFPGAPLLATLVLMPACKGEAAKTDDAASANPQGSQHSPAELAALHKAVEEVQAAPADLRQVAAAVALAQAIPDRLPPGTAAALSAAARAPGDQLPARTVDVIASVEDQLKLFCPAIDEVMREAVDLMPDYEAGARIMWDRCQVEARGLAPDLTRFTNAWSDAFAFTLAAYAIDAYLREPAPRGRGGVHPLEHELLVALASSEVPPAPKIDGFTLPGRKRGFETQLFSRSNDGPPPKPPLELFQLVAYDAPLGKNAAYVSPSREGEAKRPAIVWIVGGFEWGIDEFFWSEQPASNDQTAKTLREGPAVLMIPSLRGANGNPGGNECMYGEVDDIIAAAQWLRTREDVDPERIYLGGHSTGGTLALLVAQSTDMFAGVFALGPVGEVANYGVCDLPPDPKALEARLRAPIENMHEIRTPTWMLEGAVDGNVGQLLWLDGAKGDAPVQTFQVPGATHFSLIVPVQAAINAGFEKGDEFVFDAVAIGKAAAAADAADAVAPGVVP